MADAYGSNGSTGEPEDEKDDKACEFGHERGEEPVLIAAVNAVNTEQGRIING
jgi:hypothetical protein